MSSLPLEKCVPRPPQKRKATDIHVEFEIIKKRSPESEKTSPKTFGKRSSAQLSDSGQDDSNDDTSSNQLSSINNWRKIKGENIDLVYGQLYVKTQADDILRQLEDKIVYNTGMLAKVKLFGKWLDIPRKQTAYGDEGLSYTFSGNTVPARPWISPLQSIRDYITRVTGVNFNFVLVNRYKDGFDHVGEHKDDEKDLVATHAIASLSLGQPRNFYFKHQDSRGKNASRRDLKPIKLVLEHGSLLLMNPPTNRFWYHALPQCKRVLGLRINLTFRMMDPARCKAVSKDVLLPNS